MNYALSTLRIEGRARPVIEVEGRHYLLQEVAPDLLAQGAGQGMMALFADWSQSEAILAQLAGEIARGGVTPLPEARCEEDVLAPLLTPGKLLLGGANYYEHMRLDAGKPDFSKETAMPVFFLKPPSTSLVGSGKSMRFPVQSSELDWEIELAVVLGRTLRRASVGEAQEAIAAYCIGLDMSVRDWQMNQRHPWGFDIFSGKAFDDSCPMGPKLVPARFVDDTNLDLRLWVNGVLKQDANTSDMIWTPAEQLSALSQHTTLESGDILLTGTPAGVGMPRRDYLSVGDRIEATITGLSRLAVEIQPDGPAKPVQFAI